MTRELTSKPVKDELVASDILTYGIRDLKKRLCGVIYASLNIKGFALMYLLVGTVDPDKTISFELRLSKLDAECNKLVTEFIRYFVRSMNEDTTNRLWKCEGWGQQTHPSSFGLHVVT